ncbi:MAG: LytTR family DNA-binding domain-containing protein [Bacteroidales bacterium]
MKSVDRQTTTVAIIEDDQEERESIRLIIESYFSDLQIIGEAETIKESKDLIYNYRPGIVIMDIELKDGNSFQLLNQLDSIDFQIIWLTAYEEYAIRAFRISAVDYLLKPYKTHELVKALMKAREDLKEQTYLKKIRALLNNSSGKTDKQIVLHTSDSVHVVKIQDIIRCQSDNNYTTFFLENGQKILLSKPLKKYDDLLSDFNFYRVHQSHLINLHKVSQLNKGSKSQVLLNNEEIVPVAHHKMKDLIHSLDSL